MRMTGRISIQLSVPMDVDIKGDDIEANLELEAFKLLKLDDVQKANIDMDIITDEMREVVPARWIFWRQHCLGCIGKDSPELMARRMVEADRFQAMTDIIQYNTSLWKDSVDWLFEVMLDGRFKGYDLVDFAKDMMRVVWGDANYESHFERHKAYGFSVHIMNGARYPDVDGADFEEVEE